MNPFLIPKKIDIIVITINARSNGFKNSEGSIVICSYKNCFNNTGSKVRLPNNATIIARAVNIPKYIVG